MFATVLKYVIADIALHVFFDQLERNLTVPQKHQASMEDGELVLVHLTNGDTICGCSIVYSSASSVVVCCYDPHNGCWVNQSVDRSYISAINILSEWELSE